ncbi:hypothetical protein [Dongia deserti]|uniref:hypothetical protein n=1 Tax=Dongia deserti TaxID=2268030 RepID=UPI000E65CB5B|nr:hypothetical protein [Dongia deserti]
MHLLRLAALLICGFLWAESALAVEITHEGITFSDEGGGDEGSGFTLLSVSGRGSLDDPYVIVEDVTGPRQAILTIRGLKRVGNRIGTHHIAGIAVTKIVFNRSEGVWQNYQLELREILTRHSPYEDGLSFAQNTVIAGAFTASSFPNLQRFDEPQDTLGFSGKSVPPGESAQFSFLITDMSPVERFYLFQEPLQPVSYLENPGEIQQGALPIEPQAHSRRPSTFAR